MIRLFLVIFAAFGSAFAQAPLTERVGDAIRSAALLPDAADVRLLSMTPVRGAVEQVEITNFDRRSGRFEAVIANGPRKAQISGRAAVTLPVVVAARNLGRDHTLAAGDLEVRHVPIQQVPSTAYNEPQEAFGMAVRRSLAAGRPVRQEDLGQPLIIRKNEVIEITYETAGMVLSARGRSLDEGARGDFIRVVTEGQGRTVSAEIVAPGRVVVR
ncbi:flagellar basal body P-ring formation protein FlgA [Parvularcula sp. ZS-1/3]|uniref:Flagella basal body P-ring formation protein FlgA n=1 Tax=Parvularcula mediterranea TaxID=2732508 RepID=A0A7Y3RNV0_9PROT|nr:flagellar basal body P-ring formation chaperone FlgA [Parvularcula mediterranea]NNU17425.1 flagellar basal body P-ring formation protein FlgA [Parvularcula mediterranea]